MVCLFLALSFSSCFQFRMSDRRQLRALQKEGVTAQLGTLTIADRTIHYTLAGKDSSKPLALFIHGSPGSSSNFLRFAEDSVLLKRFQVLLVDRPGFGYSDFGWSEPSLLRQALILNALLDSFSAPAKIVAGHSLGGPIAIRMAMDSSGSLDGVVLVAASVSPELEPNEPWRKSLNKRWLRWIMPRSFRVSNQEILPAKEELQLMENDWKNVRIPVTVIQGMKDRLVPPGNADYARRKLVNAAHVDVILLEDMNHFIPFTHPEIVVQAVLDLPID